MLWFICNTFSFFIIIIFLWLQGLGCDEFLLSWLLSHKLHITSFLLWRIYEIYYFSSSSSYRLFSYQLVIPFLWGFFSFCSYEFLNWGNQLLPNSKWHGECILAVSGTILTYSSPDHSPRAWYLSLIHI